MTLNDRHLQFSALIVCSLAIFSIGTILMIQSADSSSSSSSNMSCYLSDVPGGDPMQESDFSSEAAFKCGSVQINGDMAFFIDRTVVGQGYINISSDDIADDAARIVWHMDVASGFADDLDFTLWLGQPSDPGSVSIGGTDGIFYLSLKNGQASQQIFLTVEAEDLPALLTGFSYSVSFTVD